MLSVPDGYIAISATSGSYGNVMEADGSPTAQKVANADSKETNATIEVEEDISRDLVGPLRSVGSTKSILKQSSTDLDSQGSGRIKRAVSWHDFEGKDLHTVREFVPNENDDAELLYNPGEPKQCCVIC